MFDATAKHLLSMEARSYSEDDYCLYRAPNGARCAVGLFIPDDAYDTSMEGYPVESLLSEGYGIPKWMYEHLDLLSGLQKAHDGAEGDYADEIVRALKEVASEHLLQCNFEE